MLRPSFTSRVKQAQRETSSGSSRAMFSISEASTALASSASSSTAQGSRTISGSGSPVSADAASRSAATMQAAWKRRLAATIS